MRVRFVYGRAWLGRRGGTIRWLWGGIGKGRFFRQGWQSLLREPVYQAGWVVFRVGFAALRAKRGHGLLSVVGLGGGLGAERRAVQANVSSRSDTLCREPVQGIKSAAAA